MFAPVIGPVNHFIVTGGRTHATAVDLIHIFPARNPERTGYCVKAMLVRVERGALETHIKALCAALTTLWLVFKTLDTVKPVIYIVISIDELDSMRLGKANIFVFADLVFFNRMNIRVVKEYGVINTRCQHGLHHLTRTGRATGVQQNFSSALG